MSLDATGFRNFSIMKEVFELQHDFIESSNQMSTKEVLGEEKVLYSGQRSQTGNRILN